MVMFFIGIINVYPTTTEARNDTVETPMFVVPYSMNNAFVGRVDILEKMHAAILDSKSKGGCRPLALRALVAWGRPN